VLVVLAVGCLILRAQVQAERDLRTIAEGKFKQGQTWNFAVKFPKEGFKGNPGIAAGIPRRLTKPEDFRTCFLKVELRQIRRLKNASRMVFRVDETNENGVTKREALYFFYFDVHSEGVQVIWRGEDDNGDCEEDGRLHNIPFPFGDARPPMLGFLNKEVDGYLGCDCRGAVFRKVKKEEGREVEVEVTHIRVNEHKPWGVAWYEDTAAVELLKDTKKTRIYWTETQKWANADDWLWTEMERRSPDGTFLVRCRRTELPKDAEQPEPPKDEKPK